MEGQFLTDRDFEDVEEVELRVSVQVSILRYLT